jgi:sec-independent protein translocase protein TatC
MAQLIDTAPGTLVPETPVSADEKVMSLAEHLTELRRRLVFSILAIGAGSVVGFFLAPTAITVLKAPLNPYYPGPLIFLQPGAAFFLELKLALMIGVALAAPFVLYQLWAFVAPGLTLHERTVTRPWVPLALLLLLLGIGVAYVVLPYAMGFLISFQIVNVMQPQLTVEGYFGFVTTLFLAFGLVMEFPIVLVLLSKTGIVTVERLRRNRRYVIFAIAIFAVVATPGGDPVSPTFMAAVMYPLYELSIFLIGRSERAAANR